MASILASAGDSQWSEDFCSVERVLVELSTFAMHSHIVLPGVLLFPVRKREEHATGQGKARDNSAFDRGSCPFGGAMLWLSSESASPLECTLLRFQLPSSLESAVARLKDLKFLRMNRYRKGGAGWTPPNGEHHRERQFRSRGFLPAAPS